MIDTHSDQAKRIIAKFGSPYKLAATLKEIGRPVTPMTVYRWRYDPPLGTGGRIPARWVEPITGAALIAGVTLTAEDWDPR
jgi:hypothetical protein